MNTFFEKKNTNGAVFFRSTEFTAPHGFSTRLGGVSKIPHLAEMNLGKNLNDEPEAVEANYSIILNSIGLKPNSVVFANQIHSNIVKKVCADDIGRTYDCDGFVTDCKDVTLCVRTADCVPILLQCDDICVAAVHAGWRGTVSGIQRNAVNEMIKLGAAACRIKVAIGACIHKCCYEVGSDFINEVAKQCGQKFAHRHITKDTSGRTVADLVSMNTELLLESGIKENHIFVLDECTCCNPELFFSHRASGGKRGVMGAFIALE